VPWCETCDRFLSPSTVHTDGTCPSCGRTVDAGRAHAPVAHESGAHAPGADESGAHESGADAPGDEDDLPEVPWHLKLLAAAVAVYLGYRAFQGIEWLVGRF
jgi:hypothetical protein